MSTFRYKAFISYSHQDRSWALWLHRRIESYRIPPEVVATKGAEPHSPEQRLKPCFRDREELASSSDLGHSVTEAIAQSEYLIVVCSPAAARSRWVNEEVCTFCRLRGPEFVLCALVEGGPESAFPPALAEGGAEPLAADFRPGGDGRGQGKLKLVAGLLRVGLDDLRRRDLQVRYRRLAYGSAALTLLTALTAGLATLAYLAQVEAEHERDRAQFEVRTLRGTGNLLVDLFQADIDSTSARELLDRALAAVHGDGYPAATRARMMHTIAQIHVKLGEHDRALELFETSLAIKTEELAEGHTTVAVGLRDLGSLYRRRLDYEPARRLLGRALALHERIDGDLEETAATALSLGDLHLEFNELDEAEPLLLRSVAIREQIGSPYLLSSLNALAGLRLEQQRFQDARRLYGRIMDLARNTQGEDSPWIPVTNANLGLLHNETGEHEAALELAMKARPFLIEGSQTQRAILDFIFAQAHAGLGDAERASQHFDAVIERALGEDAPATLGGIAVYAYEGLADLKADPHEQRAVLERGLCVLTPRLPADYPDLVVLARRADRATAASSSGDPGDC